MITTLGQGNIIFLITAAKGELRYLVIISTDNLVM